MEIRKLLEKKQKKGQINLMVGLLLGFMVISIFITLIPGFVELIDYAKSSQGLNCRGYLDFYDDGGNFTYNSTVGQKSSVACLGMNLYLPYLVLAVLIGLVVKILYDRQTQQPF